MTDDVEKLHELVDEGLDFFGLTGDEGDKLYVRSIRQYIAAKDAEIEALRELCGMAYQLAGVHNAPEKWLDALSNAAAGRPFSTDGLLPSWPQAVSEATQPGGSGNDH